MPAMTHPPDISVQSTAERLLVALARAGYLPVDAALDDEYGVPIPLDADMSALMDRLDRRHCPPRWARPGEDDHLQRDLAEAQDELSVEAEGRRSAEDELAEMVRLNDKEITKREDAEREVRRLSDEMGELENELAALRDERQSAS